METKTDYQRRLAESLVRSVGPEEAVAVALENQWLGVLEHLPRPAPVGRAGARTRAPARAAAA